MTFLRVKLQQANVRITSNKLRCSIFHLQKQYTK